MIRGSGEVTLSNFQKESAKSFGCGRRFGHSIEKWRTLIRQAWLLGFLHRKLSIGNGTNMLASIAFATFSVSSTGMDRLTEGQGSPVMLPMNPVTSEEQSGEKKKEETNTSNSVSKQRKGQGCHVLTTLKKLIADKEYWFAITNSDGYNYPGVFHEPYPKRLGYCEDITKLPNYDKIDPHFMFSDIQIGKGKARPKRTIKIDVAGVVESVVYRFVPCGGVKVCGKHSDGCNFVTSTTSIKPCCQHSNVPLQRTGECPVVFIYIWPENESDNRRWLTGIVRSSSLQADNFHNHPLHSEAKIPAKVDSDLRRALIENPHLKTSDLIVGMSLLLLDFNNNQF